MLSWEFARHFKQEGHLRDIGGTFKKAEWGRQGINPIFGQKKNPQTPVK